MRPKRRPSREAKPGRRVTAATAVLATFLILAMAGPVAAVDGDPFSRYHLKEVSTEALATWDGCTLDAPDAGLQMCIHTEIRVVGFTKWIHDAAATPDVWEESPEVCVDTTTLVLAGDRTVIDHERLEGCTDDLTWVVSPTLASARLTTTMSLTEEPCTLVGDEVICGPTPEPQLMPLGIEWRAVADLTVSRSMDVGRTRLDGHRCIDIKRSADREREMAASGTLGATALGTTDVASLTRETLSYVVQCPSLGTPEQ